MFKNLDKYRIVLASNSPRRKALLKEMGLEFTTAKYNGDEDYPKDLPPISVAEYLAKKKASHFNDFSNNELYITADTVVVRNLDVLGKPKTSNEAVLMLESLSGTIHHVVTGVCIKTKDLEVAFHSVTEVCFNPLEKDAIAHYVAMFDPMDKAGSYGIQEWIGMIGIEGINGSYFNVVGLPTHKLYNELKKIP